MDAQRFSDQFIVRNICPDFPAFIAYFLDALSPVLNEPGPVEYIGNVGIIQLRIMRFHQCNCGEFATITLMDYRPSPKCQSISVPYCSFSSFSVYRIISQGISLSAGIYTSMVSASMRTARAYNGRHADKPSRTYAVRPSSPHNAGSPPSSSR